MTAPPVDSNHTRPTGTRREECRSEHAARLADEDFLRRGRARRSARFGFLMGPVRMGCGAFGSPPAALCLLCVRVFSHITARRTWNAAQGTEEPPRCTPAQKLPQCPRLAGPRVR